MSSRSSGSSAFAASGQVGIAVALHVAGLDVDDATFERLNAMLSQPELRRAATFRDALDRRRFAADHGYRRVLLGAVLGCEPTAVEYDVGAYGKPELVGGGARFSASRTRDVALYATTETAEVGVDVEPVAPDSELAPLVRRVLTPAERAAWEALPPSQRRAALYACWTRKEAHGKAVGTGLVFPLDELELWAGDDRPVWCGDVVVHCVELPAELRAAVAVRARPGRTVSIAAPAPLAMPSTRR